MLLTVTGALEPRSGRECYAVEWKQMAVDGLVVVTGGARSGKSGFAEQLAREAGEPVVYLATARADDAEMQERIDRHRRTRPPIWRTVEEPYFVPAVVQREMHQARVVLVDCLTLWVTNLLFQGYFPEPEARDFDFPAGRREEVLAQVRELARVAVAGPAKVIVVTNEVGMGLVPEYAAGRVYRDLAGWANQIVAAAAGEVYLLVAGVPLKIK